MRNISFALDAKVLFKTFKTVFTQEGVYIENEAGAAAARDAADRGLSE